MKTAAVVIASILATSLLGCSADSQTEKSFDKGTEYKPTTPSGFQATAYPVGPYGTGTGSIIANQEFLGWHAPTDASYDTGAMEKVSLAEYYNPNGDKPIKAIWLNSAAVWCSACRAEYNGDIGICDDGKNTNCECSLTATGSTSCSANTQYCGGAKCVRKTMAQHAADLKDKGVMVIGTLFEDNSNPPGPAKPDDLNGWASNNWGPTLDGQVHEVNFPMGLDPAFKLGGYFTSDAVPMTVVIDTKTMLITAKILGGDLGGVQTAIDDILAAN